MMIHLNLEKIGLLGLFTALLLPPLLPAQLVQGQYEDEAPVATWNRFAAATAASLGRGGVLFSLADDASAGVSNPALLSCLPGFTLQVNYGLDKADFFRYGPVNTGTLPLAANLSEKYEALDSAGASFRVKGWTLAMNLVRLEDYGRPAGILQYSDRGYVYYRFHFEQSGSIHDINLAVSRKIGGKISLGIGFNIIYGKLSRSTWEEWPYDGTKTESLISQKFSGFFLNAGLAIDFSQYLAGALVLRTPHARKSRSHSLLGHHTSAVDIQIEADEEDRYYQPLAAGAGVRWQPWRGLQVASDITFFNWSRYKATCLGEEKVRDFRDILVFATGAEYTIGLSHSGMHIPLRTGFRYDPQPIRNPHITYWLYSIGAGLHGKALQFDAGVLLGKEKGSGRNLTVSRAAISLGVAY